MLGKFARLATWMLRPSISLNTCPNHRLFTWMKPAQQHENKGGSKSFAVSQSSEDGRIQLGPSSGDPPESNSSFWSWQKVLAEGSGRGMPHKDAANALPVEREREERERERERERGGGGGGDINMTLPAMVFPVERYAQAIAAGCDRGLPCRCRPVSRPAQTQS